MNHGVEFEINGVRKHSFDDWGLIFKPFPILYPEPKTSYIEIEGGNGSIDHTEVFGKIFYKNRKFSIEFECFDKIKYDDTLRKIVTFLHGRVAKITMYFDYDFYYKGRIKFNKYTSSKATGAIVLDIDAEPYKYKKEITVQTNQVDTKSVIVYKNNRMEVIPTFQATDNMTFDFNGNTYSLGTTETIFPDVEFVEGDNIIVWHGNGIVTVTYQEGAL